MLDVRKSREFRAALIAVRVLDRTMRKMIRQHVKGVVGPAWSDALNRRSSTALERRVIAATAVVQVSDRNVRVKSASKGRRMSGGLNPKTDFPAVEFGALDDTQVYSRRNRRAGGTHRVKRHTARQLRPRKATGYVFFPSVDEMVPRLAALYIQTIVKTIGNAIEGKQE